MSIDVQSFAGHSLNDATYRARLLADALPRARAVAPVLNRPTGQFPHVVRSDPQEITLQLAIELLDPTTANVEQLMARLAPGTEGALVVSFDGTGRAIDCVVQGIAPYAGAPNHFTATLLAPDARWRSLSEQPVARGVTASGQTFTIANLGNTPDDSPRFYIQPRMLKDPQDGQRYQREIVVANRCDRPLTNYAIELTGGGWNHAAEVSAGRSRSDGNDVRVLVDGVEVPRWDGGGASTSWNDTATKIWANLHLSDGRTATLRNAVTASSPASGEDLEVEPGGVSGWPRSGFLLLGDEVISYHGLTENNANGQAAFQNIARAQRGTTAGAVSAGATLHWIERRVQLMYGRLNASAPAAADHLKPVIDLNVSTNTSHRWGTEFVDLHHPGRSMQWQRQLLEKDSQRDRILAPEGSPGWLSFEYQKEGAVAGKPNFNAFSLPIPAGTTQSGNAFTFTRAIDDTLGLGYFARDAIGSEIELRLEGGVTASATTTIPADPAKSYTSFDAYCRSQVVVSNGVGVVASDRQLTNAYLSHQQFTAPSDGTILAWGARIEDETSGGNTVKAAIHSDSGSDEPLDLVSDEPTAITVDATTAWYDFAAIEPLIVEAGQRLWLSVLSTSGLTHDWPYNNMPFPGGVRASGNIGAVTPETGAHQFRVLSMDMDFDPQAAATDGDTASISSFTANLNPLTAPRVNFGDQQDAYFLDAKLTNLVTGQQVHPQRLLAPLDVLEIDVANRAVRNLSEGPARLTLSGNEVTDATRLAAVEGDGLAVPDSSVGIWPATTNLCTNGGFESNTTGWSPVNVATLTTSTDQARFGAQSLKIESTLSLGFGANFVVTVPSAGRYVFSAWVYAPTGAVAADLQIRDAASFSGGSAVDVTHDDTNGTKDEWVRIWTILDIVAGDLSGFLQVYASTGAPGEYFYVDGVQIEKLNAPTPYVETNGGTASRSASRVQANASMLDEAVGFFAARVRMGFDSDDDLGGVGVGPRLFTWQNLVLYWSDDDRKFRMRRGNGFSEVIAATAAQSFNAGDIVTVFGYWTANQVGVGVNGGLTTASGGNIPAHIWTLFDVGSGDGIFDYLRGEFLWAAWGGLDGTPTAADAAAVHAFGNNDPDPQDFPAVFVPTGVWHANDASFIKPGLPAPDATPRVDGRPIVTDRDHWLQIAPGANTLQLTEPGLTNVLVSSRHHSRWE